MKDIHEEGHANAIVLAATRGGPHVGTGQTGVFPIQLIDRLVRRAGVRGVCKVPEGEHFLFPFVGSDGDARGLVGGGVYPLTRGGRAGGKVGDADVCADGTADDTDFRGGYEGAIGIHIALSEVLFVVADVSTMWVILNVGLEHVERLKVGQSVLFLPDSYSGGTVAGDLSWISTEVDEKTRTIEVRADIPNPEGDLRSNTFGKARVVIRENPEAVVVPEDSVHWEGCCYVVFVRQEDTIFETRKVNLGVKTGASREVVAGLLPGEVIATTGSHVMKSDLLKNNLGAG